MTFSEALELLKQGKKVSRISWNGVNQYIYLGKEVTFRAPDGVIVMADFPSIIFKGTSGTQCGWLATQSDMLSEDWVVYAD